MGDGACCHYCRRHECVCHRLPNGENGTISEYLGAWGAIADGLAERYGMVVYAFDPGVRAEFAGSTVTLTATQAMALLSVRGRSCGSWGGRCELPARHALQRRLRAGVLHPLRALLRPAHPGVLGRVAAAGDAPAVKGYEITTMDEAERQHYKWLCERSLKTLDREMRCKALAWRATGGPLGFQERINRELEHLDCLTVHYYCGTFGADYCEETADD